MKILMTLIFLTLSVVFSDDFTFKELPIQEDGRIKPLDTYARNQMLRFYGKRSFKDNDGNSLSAVNWFQNLVSNTKVEMERPVFNIRNPEVTYSLGLDKNDVHKYSFLDIINGFRDNEELLNSLSETENSEKNLVEKQIVEIYQNVIVFDDIAHSMYCFLPLIEVDNQVLLDYFSIDQKRLSYSFFMRNIDKFKVLLEDLINTEEGLWNDTHLELSRIAMQLQDLTQYHYAQKLKIIPSFDDSLDTRWNSPWELMDGRPLNQDEINILFEYENLMLGIVDNNQEKINVSSMRIVSIIENYDEKFNPNLLAMESSYNNMNIFQFSLVAYILSFLLIGLSWMYHPVIFRQISLLSTFLGFCLHGYGLILRMVIMQRPPVTTLYESILFVSFILVLFSIIFEILRKDTLGVLIAAIGGSVLHFVGFKYAADGDTLGMLVAVLNSNFWLSTHVTTITIGYGVSLVAGLMGHLYLIFAYVSPNNKTQLNKIFNNMYGLTLMGLFFTMFGTILGGIWADQSWGRFWGWDPKENGALLIVLWHLMMLHLRISGMVKPLGYAFGISLVNIIVVLAWFGVNLLSVGLHSYGFTDNAALNLILFIVIELVFTGLLYFLVKRKYFLNFNLKKI